MKLTVMLLMALMLFNGLVFAKHNVDKQTNETQQDENAILRDALKQALNKLADYKNQIEAADRVIESFKKERQLAKQQRDASNAERIASNKVIFQADKAIAEQQALIVELKNESKIQSQLAKNLQKQLAGERFKVKVYKALTVFALISGVVVGIFASK